jgi:hypothetical protein
MKIGFYTSTFNDRPVEEVVDFAKEAGFDAIELDVGGHIKTPDKVAGVVQLARDRGLYVSSVTLFGNQLDPDAAKRKELNARTCELARAIADADVPIFVIFPGRDNTVSADEDTKRFLPTTPMRCSPPRPVSTWRSRTGRARTTIISDPRPALRRRVRPLPPDPARHRPLRGVRRRQGPAEDSAWQGHLDRPAAPSSGRLSRRRLVALSPTRQRPARLAEIPSADESHGIRRRHLHRA